MPLDIQVAKALEKALREEFKHVQDDDEVLLKPKSPSDLGRTLLEEALLERRRKR